MISRGGAIKSIHYDEPVGVGEVVARRAKLMDLQTLGRRVKRHREDLNETPEQVASYARLPLAEYLNLEGGTYEPSVETLKLLAAQLSVPLAYLEGEGEDI